MSHCAYCGYELAGSPRGPCPECGRSAPDLAAVRRSIIRGVRILAAVPLALVAALWLSYAFDPIPTSGRVDFGGGEWLGYWASITAGVWCIGALVIVGWQSIASGEMASQAPVAVASVTCLRRVALGLAFVLVAWGILAVGMNLIRAAAFGAGLLLLVGIALAITHFVISHVLVCRLGEAMGDRLLSRAALRAVISVPICLVLVMVVADDMAGRYDYEVGVHAVALAGLIPLAIGCEGWMLWRLVRAFRTPAS